MVFLLLIDAKKAKIVQIVLVSCSAKSRVAWTTSMKNYSISKQYVNN